MDPIIIFLFKRFYEDKYKVWLPPNSKFHHFRKEIFNKFWIKSKEKILNKNQLLKFIINKFPAKNVYYSISKWAQPEKIGPKNRSNRFLGSNLVFDFDNISNPIDIEEFERGKNEVIELKKFLEKTFGFKKFGYLWTGNKGFHLHVKEYNYLTFFEEFIQKQNQIDMNKLNIIEIEQLNRKYILDTINEYNFKIDSNVITDLLRIVRLPGTLHGSTGLQSIYLESFNEFRDLEIDQSFGMNDYFDIKLFFTKDIPEYNLNTITIGPYKKGKILDISARIACFLILQYNAKIVSKPDEISIFELEPYIWLENKVRWCKNCNIPILESKICPKCSNNTFLVHLSGVGDARPAFKINIERIRKLLDSQYKTKIGELLIPDDKIILLNRVPRARSRQIEIIVDGFVIGKIKYSEEELKFKFVPSIEGANRLFKLKAGDWVVIDEKVKLKTFQFLSKGDIIDSHLSDLYSDGLVHIIQKGRMVGLGKINQGTKNQSKYVQILSVRKVFKDNTNIGGQTWADVVNANKSLIEKYEKDTILFMKGVKNLYKDLDVTVPFSGGKDSLVTVALTKKALEDFTVNFVRSEIEFPETNEYVKNCIEKLGLLDKYIELYEPQNLKKISSLLGPPQIDNKWCCKIYKFGPTNKLYREHFPNGCLSFVGLRSYESNSRTLNYRININPWLPNAISVHPIYDWNALMIWLYIFKNKLPINPVYEIYGRERVGCWICPHQDLSNFHLLRLDHKNLWNYLLEILNIFKDQYNLDEKLIKYGLWRWTDPPERVKNWAKNKKIELKPLRNIRKTELDFIKVGESKNINGNRYIVNGNIDEFTNLNDYENFLNILGPIKYEKNKNMEIRTKNGSINILADGRFSIQADNKYYASEILNNLRFSILRFKECIGCLNCISLCEYGAIYQVNSEIPPLIDEEKCVHCLKCNFWCPLLKFSVIG
ncbi:MAG: phosphoadenosine phosphosulfate reductase domain-containing protein [Candidatus Helarchaeota archaeon]